MRFLWFDVLLLQRILWGGAAREAARGLGCATAATSASEEAQVASVLSDQSAQNPQPFRKCACCGAAERGKEEMGGSPTNVPVVVSRAMASSESLRVPVQYMARLVGSLDQLLPRSIGSTTHQNEKGERLGTKREGVHGCIPCVCDTLSSKTTPKESSFEHYTTISYMPLSASKVRSRD